MVGKEYVIISDNEGVSRIGKDTLKAVIILLEQEEKGNGNTDTLGNG